MELRRYKVPGPGVGSDVEGSQYHESALLADRPPFEDLYRDYLGRIYAYVRAQVGSSADAEDITAVVFMNAYLAYARFEARNATPAAWLFRIARNATLDHFRAHGRRERLRRTIEHQPVAGEDPAGMAEERMRYRALLQHVARLPERQRDAISLRHSGLSFEEVGRLMSCSEDAAKMLYHRALKALREAVDRGGE
ncbi:RNA polymerase sigma factor [bacterium]|nr:MAG: RNA polymerase sigma factor [bacterium]